MNVNFKMTVGVSVSIPDIFLQYSEFAAAFHDRVHSRETEGTELGVKRIDGIPKLVHRRRGLYQLLCDFLDQCVKSSRNDCRL
jgi:hypothetical protein